MSNWQERWEQGMIGWHGSNVNPYLDQNSSVLFEENNDPRILIPLCGKSLDITWLANRTGEVVGVELIQKAIDDFYQENNIIPQRQEDQGLLSYSQDNIKLICSSFFDLTAEKIGTFDAIYDRASLVAIPPEKRQEYVALCLSLLKKGGQILLITYDAPVPETKGPPFPIKTGVIPKLYQNASECIQLSENTDLKANNPRLQRRNLDWSKTSIWKIIK